MDTLWYKYKDLSKRKKQTLHSVIAGFVFFAFLFILTKKSNASLCPINNIFGVSCPGCGLTRGFISITQLNFEKATEYNVFSVPLFIGVAVYCILAIYDIFSPKNHIKKIEEILSKKYMYPIYFITLIVGYFCNNI